MINSTLREAVLISWPTLVIVLSIIIILRITYITRSDRKFVLHEELFDLIFISYVLVLFNLVASQDIAGGGTNLMPFREILRYEIGSSSFYKQVVGNILLFVPLGYFSTRYCNLKGLGIVSFIMLLCSTIIESVQHFIGRSFDIDDIILNLVGGVIGFLIHIALKAIGRHMPDFLRRDWIKNIFALLIIVLIGLQLYRVF